MDDIYGVDNESVAKALGWDKDSAIPDFIGKYEDFDRYVLPILEKKEIVYRTFKGEWFAELVSINGSKVIGRGRTIMEAGCQALIPFTELTRTHSCVMMKNRTGTSNFIIQTCEG